MSYHSIPDFQERFIWSARAPSVYETLAIDADCGQGQTGIPSPLDAFHYTIRPVIVIAEVRNSVAKFSERVADVIGCAYLLGIRMA